MARGADGRTRSPRRPQRTTPFLFAGFARFAFIVVTIVVITAAGWFLWQRAAQPAIEPGACRGCNVLLITIDTLRLDRVGAFGGRGGLTPHLDALAAEGLRLTRAYSTAPLTLPSHASILTALSPPVHGLRANGLFRLGPGLPTLATVLKSAGYRTGAFVGSFVLDARFGLNRGFDEYDDRYGEKQSGDAAESAERRAADVIAPASAWILGRDGKARSPQSPAPSPWFAWVHLYDPHEPYRAPEPYASRFEPYDAEVAYSDASIGTLLADLRGAGQLDRTLVMVLADHGESLGEHGERTHGVFVYDVTMRVPWIVWAGAHVPRRSSDALVRLVDVAPTLLDLLGVAAPVQFEGRSVLPAVNSGSDDARSAYVEAMDANLTRNWAPLTGIVAQGFKLIDLPIPELYDLRSDPRETTNLFARDPARARELESLLRTTTTEFQSRESSGLKTTLNADARQRLQALGYVASSADPSARAYTDADDPKTLIGPANDVQGAVTAFNTGARAEGMAALAAIREQHPRFTTAYGMYATMQRATGDLPGAIATLEDAARRGIANQDVMVVLAGYLQEAGDAGRAVQVLEAVVASHPDYAEAYNSLGVVFTRLGRHDRARAALRKVLELDPTSAKAYENLAVDELSAGDVAPAIADLRRALDLDPHLYDALYNLALALTRSGHRDEAKPYLERFMREAPPARYAREIVEFKQLLGK